MSRLTMGSLFDGIGGFPLAAIRSGITPVWASEIEAFPIEVTKLRFPDMVHVGDITKLHGAELPPVDIICGGSPCQDYSEFGITRISPLLAQGQVLPARVLASLWSRCALCVKCGWQRKPVAGRASTYGRAGCVGRTCRGPFQAENRSMRTFGSCWRRSCGSAFPTSLSQAPILTDGPMSVISRQAICFLLRGAVWTLNYVQLNIIELMYS